MLPLVLFGLLRCDCWPFLVVLLFIVVAVSGSSLVDRYVMCEPSSIFPRELCVEMVCLFCGHLF